MPSASPAGSYEILGAGGDARHRPEIPPARRAAMATLRAGRQMRQGIQREPERRYPAIAAA